MNQIKLLSTLLLLTITGMAYSQTRPLTAEELPYIEVIGTAEEEVTPDEIYINITIREKYQNKVKITIEEQEVKLLSALKSLGIDMNNLFLSDANADYVKIRWQKKDVLTSKDYTLKVSNATTVGQVFLKLDELEIADAYMARVNHSKLDSLEKKIEIRAIKDAKDKADYLLNAIGEQTGKPILIRENEYLPNRATVTDRSYLEGVYVLHESKMKAEYDKNELQFQKIKIRKSIYVKFAIK